jgi:hypothetical protein
MTREYNLNDLSPYKKLLKLYRIIAEADENKNDQMSLLLMLPLTIIDNCKHVI